MFKCLVVVFSRVDYSDFGYWLVVFFCWCFDFYVMYLFVGFRVYFNYFVNGLFFLYGIIVSYDYYIVDLYIMFFYLLFFFWYKCGEYIFVLFFLE